MDLQNFKFDFSGFNLDNTETKEEDKKVMRPKEEKVLNDLKIKRD